MKSLYDIEIEMKLQQHYKIKTVAKLYEISEKTIRRWIRDGKLKVIKVDKMPVSMSAVAIV